MVPVKFVKLIQKQRPEVFYEALPMTETAVNRCSSKCILKNLANFTGKHLCWSLFLIKLQAFKVQHRCFPMKFTKFLRTKFYYRTPLVATSGASHFADNSTFHNSRKFSRVHVFAGMLLNRKTHWYHTFIRHCCFIQSFLIG